MKAPLLLSQRHGLPDSRSSPLLLVVRCPRQPRLMAGRALLLYRPNQFLNLPAHIGDFDQLTSLIYFCARVLKLATRLR